jgi:hypothetical protein
VIILSLILIRAANKKKALNALADIERHAKLTIDGKPRLLDVDEAEDVTRSILKQKPKSVVSLFQLPSNPTIYDFLTDLS